MNAKNPFDGVNDAEDFVDLLKGFTKPVKNEFQRKMEELKEKMNSVGK